MNRKRYIVSTSKALISGLAAVFFIGYAVFYLTRGLWAETAVFAALGGLFAWQLVKNASFVEVTEEHIRLRFGPWPRRTMPWPDVREMGVIGEEVFRFGRKGKRVSGEKFIYFSPQEMTEQERFRMIVRWPPKEALYIEYSPEALAWTQTIWDGPVKYYNAEDLYPNTKD